MLDDDSLTNELRGILLEVCAVLDNHGIKKIRIGAMMRLLGVGSDVATQFDDEWFELDDEFYSLYASYKQELKKLEVPEGTVPEGTVFH